MKGAWVMACGLVMASGERAVRAEGEEEGPKNAITLEPLAVVYARTIAVEYERGFGHVGVHVGGAVTLGDFEAGDGNGDYLALGATLGVRFYPWSDAPEGPFVGPFGSVALVDATSSDGGSANGLGWSAGAMVGWAWALGGVFALSLGAGAAWYSYDVDGPSGTTGRTGFLPALRLAVGAAF